MSANKYLDEYQKQIKAGKIRACKKLKLALKRDQQDLKRSASKDWPFYYDPAKADQCINILQILTTTDGKPLRLTVWQKWLTSALFGWRVKGTGTRRFTQLFFSLSRKNGKSFYISTLLFLYLLVEQIPARGRNCVVTANSFKQAKITFDMLANNLRLLCQSSPSLQKRLKINQAEIRDEKTGSQVLALASKPENLFGYPANLAVIDEYSEAPDSKIKDLLRSGQVNSPNALLALISTSGNNFSSPMYSDYKHAGRVLNGKEQDDTALYVIYEQDRRSEMVKALKDPMLLEKSNPLLCKPECRKILLPHLLDDIKTAIARDNELPTLVRNCNMWIQAHRDSYLTAKSWEKQTVPKMDLQGKPCWIGLDLSRSRDLTSVSWLVGYEDKDGQRKLYADSFSFVATVYGLDDKIRRDKFDYRKAAKRGECSIADNTSNGLINYDAVYNFVINWVEQTGVKVQGLMFDPWSAAFIADRFSKVFTTVEVRQGAKTLSSPILSFREDLLKGKITHPDNKLLQYAALNAICKYDSNQNVLLDKTQVEQKIDPLAALIDAFVTAGQWLTGEGTIKHDKDFYSSKDFGF